MQGRCVLERVGALCAAALLMMSGAASPAQSAPLNQAISAELQSLAAGAGSIFVGQITSIVRKNSFVEVTFRVEQPLAGSAGAAYVMREWAGLWPPGHLRYTVGQRVLAFLHTPSGAGLSSPVHGAEGLVPVVVQGADAPQLIDLRRVAAAVVRAPGTPLPTEANGAMLLSDALAVVFPKPMESSRLPAHLPLPQRGKRPLDLPQLGAPHGIVLHEGDDAGR